MQCCCDSAGLYIGTYVLGENIRQALASPVSSCPAAIDKDV